MNRSNDKGWQPTGRLIYGVIMKSFLPLQKFPELVYHSNYYSNIYVGAEVYIFEMTNDNKWCRGYFCSRPLPDQFISTMTTLGDKLPSVQPEVVIFPKKCAHIFYEISVNTMPFFKLPEVSDFQNLMDTNCKSSSLFTSLESDKDSEVSDLAASKPSHPSFPFFRYLKRPLRDELGAVLALLCSHIYAMYSAGEFVISEELTKLYNELDNTRLKLQFELTTEPERIILIRSASCLLAKISKFISSKGRTNGTTVKSYPITPDPNGFEGIFARDINTGELVNYETTNLQGLMVSSMLYGLTNNFPLVSPESVDLDYKPQNLFNNKKCHLLIDFHEIVSDASINNPRLNNITAAVHLRTETEMLTEPYKIDLSSQLEHFGDRLSAVFIKDISRAIIERGKIFLVMSLTEKVKINASNQTPQSQFRAPFIPIEQSDQMIISSIKRGVAAGVVDISPSFVKGKNLTSIRKYKIDLYSPFSHDNNDQNATEKVRNANSTLGWGAVVSKLINRPTNSGLRINPRVVSLSLSIKEVESDEKKLSILKLPIRSAREIHLSTYDKVSAGGERIHLSLGKISLCGVNKKVKNIKSVTVKVLCYNSEITFSENSNDRRTNSWKFVSVEPGEYIGETVRINNLEKLEENEHILICVYLNGYLMARASMAICMNHRIIEYPKGTTLPLYSSQDRPLIELEVSSKYLGTKYNIPTAIRFMMELSTAKYANNPKYSKLTMRCLRDINLLQYNQLHNNFETITKEYLEILLFAHRNKTVMMLDDLAADVLAHFVRFLHITLSAPTENCKQNFYEMYNRYRVENSRMLPEVGGILLNYMRDSLTNIGSISVQYRLESCETSIYLLMLSSISLKNSNKWRELFEKFLDAACEYLRSTEQYVVEGQIALLEASYFWITTLREYYEPEQLIGFITKVFKSCQDKEKALNLKAINLTYQDEQYLNTKFCLLRKILCHDQIKEYLFHQRAYSDAKILFISKCIEWTLEPFLLQNDNVLQIATIRLANGVVITLLENILNRKILRNMVRLLPTYCKFFIMIRKYYKKSDLFKTSRSFTKLFPTDYPFEKLPMDSIVNDEIVVEVLLEIATIICEITKVAFRMYGQSPSFIEVIEECSGDDEFSSPFYITEVTKEHVFTITRTIKILFKGEFFPERKWLGVTALFIRGSLELLVLCKDFMILRNAPLEGHANNELSIDMKLWAEYIKSLLQLSNHKVCVLVRLAIIPRKAVYRISGNLKRQASRILEASWDALGRGHYDIEMAQKYGIGQISQYQLMLLKEHHILTRELLIFSFHRHIDATGVSCKILWCMIILFWKEYGTSQPILDICIPELYNGYQDGKLFVDDYELERYINCITYVIHLPMNDPLYPVVLDFLKELLGFLHIIAEAYKIPSQEEFDDDRIARHIEMFGYLLDANKPELFHKMVNDLYVHSIRKKDYVQAALGLELLASTYPWNPNDYLPAIEYPSLPRQSSFERKEYLFKEAAHNFSRGLKFEKALSVYRDLIKAYDEINYDLNGLAFVHDQIATIYTELQSIDRLVPTYFKVSFMGYGFPNSLRNKSFIFEGLPFEHITSMHSRLLKIYHGSTIVREQEKVDEIQMKPPMGKFIYVTTVEPQFSISDEYISSVKRSSINNKVRMYIENRDLRTFSNSRRLPGSTGIIDLWVEEYTYTTFATFPTLMYRSEIKNVEKKILSPLESAIRSLQMKIQELNGLENMGYRALKEKTDSSEVFNELSRNITGTISAPINGGITQYKEFLKAPFCDKFEDSELKKLTVTFDQLVIVLSRCLLLHLELLPSSQFKESHNLLTEIFDENFSEEIIRNNIRTSKLTSEEVFRSSSRENMTRATYKTKLYSSREYSGNIGGLNTATFDTGDGTNSILSKYTNKTNSVRSGSGRSSTSSSSDYQKSSLGQTASSAVSASSIIVPNPPAVQQQQFLGNSRASVPQEFHHHHLPHLG